jgi:nucleotidyltransferase substrate binding protein (TIGR01987 family)
MEKLRKKLEQVEKALSTLEEIFNEPYSKIVRDAGVQRFEYTFEVLWKLLKEYLSYKEGIMCNSPKSCFREAFSVGILSEEETVSFIQMTDDRNLTSHTYDEEVADLLFGKVRGYYQLMRELLLRIKKGIGEV